MKELKLRLIKINKFFKIRINLVLRISFRNNNKVVIFLML